MTPLQTSFAVTVATGLAVLAALPKRRLAREDSMEAMQAVALRVSDNGSTRTVRAAAPLTIGREPRATLCIPDPHVSRLHARIDLLDGALYIRDLDSRNGTFVNARPIDGAARLEVGDEIEIGAAHISYQGIGSWK